MARLCFFLSMNSIHVTADRVALEWYTQYTCLHWTGSHKRLYQWDASYKVLRSKHSEIPPLHMVRQKNGDLIDFRNASLFDSMLVFHSFEFSICGNIFFLHPTIPIHRPYISQKWLPSPSTPPERFLFPFRNTFPPLCISLLGTVQTKFIIGSSPSKHA